MLALLFLLSAPSTFTRATASYAFEAHIESAQKDAQDRCRVNDRCDAFYCIPESTRRIDAVDRIEVCRVESHRYDDKYCEAEHCIRKASYSCAHFSFHLIRSRSQAFKKILTFQAFSVTIFNIEAQKSLQSLKRDAILIY